MSRLSAGLCWHGNRLYLPAQTETAQRSCSGGEALQVRQQH